MRILFYFSILSFILISCGDHTKAKDLRGSWSLKKMVNEDSMNTQDDIMNSAISQGGISGTLVFENDSVYSITSTSLGFSGQSERGKYWLSTDGKLLQLISLGQTETQKIEVVDVNDDTLRLKFNPFIVSVFVKEKD